MPVKLVALRGTYQLQGLSGKMLSAASMELSHFERGDRPTGASKLTQKWSILGSDVLMKGPCASTLERLHAS